MTRDWSEPHFFFFFNLSSFSFTIILFLSVLSLRCSSGFLSLWLSRGYYLAMVWGLLIGVNSLVAEHSLQNTGLVVVARGLSCSWACGIFLDQGSNLCLLHWQMDSLPLSHQGSPSRIPWWSYSSRTRENIFVLVIEVNPLLFGRLIKYL